jgi:methyltransferase-like protein/2-polyprenyl-3-methyl-5-hydroxy-6-metoxy-1,4-benzoquinol methylase
MEGSFTLVNFGRSQTYCSTHSLLCTTIMSDSYPPGSSFTSSYDDVPYESTSFPQTHPDRLATLATLFGLTPAPVDRCRVLELGCAMGANLVPMAFHLPGSEFVGVDSSGRQVTAAREAATELGLSNIRIEHASILDVDRSWGEFDYLICHGVYSWVPEPVQDKILAIAAENLAPHGIAFVSYNTYPGWHMREMIRHMMRYHAAQFSETPERIEQARALLDFLAGSVDTTSYYGALLQSELKLVRRVRDSYLFHEHLEEINSPLYFHEFVTRADRHGLRYLAEADFSTMLASGFPTETAETLRRISPDIVRAEQYMDFLRNRYFRQTLLCRVEREPRRELDGSDLKGLLLASPVVPDEDAGTDSPGFAMPDGRQVTTGFPLTRAALGVLSESWPASLDQQTLRTLASDRLTSALDEAQLDEQWAIVLQDLLHCYSSGAVELRTWQAPFANRVSERPQVSGLAAHQARSGSLITNQRHEPVTLDVVGKCLVPVLDGTRDRGALLTHLGDAVARGALVLSSDGQPVSDEGQVRQALGGALGQALDSFAQSALLVG